MFYPIPTHASNFFCLVSDDVVLSGPQLDPSDDILRILTLPLSPSHEHPPRLGTMCSHPAKHSALIRTKSRVPQGLSIVELLLPKHCATGRGNVPAAMMSSFFVSDGIWTRVTRRV